MQFLDFHGSYRVAFDGGLLVALAIEALVDGATQPLLDLVDVVVVHDLRQ
jgi:hypothetical protein